MECTSILIIDDEATIASSMLHYFTKEGYNVVASTSGDIVLKMVDIKRFDVIITDMKMSPVSGADIINHLRDSGYKGNIILMSAHFRTEDPESEGIAADAFIEKPFSLREIHRIVRELVG